MLEDKGLVGPADGAKPREVYEGAAAGSEKVLGVKLVSGGGPDESESAEAVPEEDGDWKKV
jgi:hypothetical protein